MSAARKRPLRIVDGYAVLDLAGAVGPAPALSKELETFRVAKEIAAALAVTPLALGVRYTYAEGLSLLVAIPAKDADLQSVWETAVNAVRASRGLPRWRRRR